MNSIPPKANPKIIFLSGPSSSGKTTSTKSLEEKGWVRIEADAENEYKNNIFIQVLKRDLLDKVSYIESHYTEPSDSHTVEAIRGSLKPKEYDNQIKYEKIRLELSEYISTKDEELNEKLLIHMLNKAININKKGISVILDHVPFINDDKFYSHAVILDTESPNLWCYKDIKIEQQLKFTPIEILMFNVINRNKKTDLNEYRPMIMVLKQYADRFKAADLNQPDQVHLGNLKVAALKKWIERAVKVDFFDINFNHGFKYEKKDGDIDKAIQTRLIQFEIEMNNPEQAIDPAGEKVDEEGIKILKEKKINYPLLEQEINKTIQTLTSNMKIPDNATEVILTYVSSSGIKPTLIF